jgi:hypothetical protein
METIRTLSSRKLQTEFVQRHVENVKDIRTFRPGNCRHPQSVE